MATHRLPVCTLTLAWQVTAGTPILVAANRDERTDRPSEPPGRYASEPTVIAPRDRRAGGTWIGINEHGCFAGITNRWTDADLAAERSRGHLVADVLEEATATEAHERIAAAVARHEYDGFNLVVADGGRAYCLEWDGRLSVTALEPGVHVVVNTGFDDSFTIPDSRTDTARRQAANARAVRRALWVGGGYAEGAGDAVAPLEWLAGAARVLGDHEYGVCIHGDGYGTRSSSLVALGDVQGYAFADGPPCRTSYKDVASGASGILETDVAAAVERHL